MPGLRVLIEHCSVRKQAEANRSLHKSHYREMSRDTASRSPSSIMNRQSGLGVLSSFKENRLLMSFSFLLYGPLLFTTIYLRKGHQGTFQILSRKKNRKLLETVVLAVG